MWTWKNQRRRRTQRGRLWFIISSGGTHGFIWYRYLIIIWYHLDIELLDCNASAVHFFVIWITILLLVLWRLTRQTLVSGISTTRLVGGLSQPWLRRNWGKGTLALTPWVHEPWHGGGRDCCLWMSPKNFSSFRDHHLCAARCQGGGPSALRAIIPCSSMSWFSLLQIDLDVEEPPTQSFGRNLLRATPPPTSLTRLPPPHLH